MVGIFSRGDFFSQGGDNLTQNSYKAFFVNENHIRSAIREKKKEKSLMEWDLKSIC